MNRLSKTSLMPASKRDRAWAGVMSRDVRFGRCILGTENEHITIAMNAHVPDSTMPRWLKGDGCVVRRIAWETHTCAQNRHFTPHLCGAW